MEYYKQLENCMAFSIGSKGDFAFEHEWLAARWCFTYVNITAALS